VVFAVLGVTAKMAHFYNSTTQQDSSLVLNRYTNSRVLGKPIKPDFKKKKIVVLHI
jgi:hypothetical protein